jgi:hypothetical protein
LYEINELLEIGDGMLEGGENFLPQKTIREFLGETSFHIQV